MLKQKIFLEQLSKLVSFKTVTGDVKSNQEALEYVASLIDPSAKIKLISNQTRQILLAGNTESKKPDYTYLVHIDVVPGEATQFTVKQTGDLLYGRGVCDMKFSIPVGVALLNEIIQTKSNLKFQLAITTDEETGGYTGAKYLVDEYQLRPAVVIVPDGGNEGLIVNKSKGVCQLIITTQGKTAHASQPWNGQNAITPLIKLASKLIEKYDANNTKECWETTMNLGQINGGSAVNQVCSEATLKIDFRYPQTDSADNIIKEVKKIAKEIDEKFSIEPGSMGLPTYTDGALPIVQKFAKNLESEMGVKVEIKGECGASDARFFAPFNTPILMSKPKGGQIHSDDEWLSLGSTLKFYQALRRQLDL